VFLFSCFAFFSGFTFLIPDNLITSNYGATQKDKQEQEQGAVTHNDKQEEQQGLCTHSTSTSAPNPTSPQI